VDDLSSLLCHGRQGRERAGWHDADFLLELPLGGFKQIFTWLDFALGNRPSAVVLFLEKWTTRMCKKHLQPAIVKAVHQQSSADTGHRKPPLSLPHEIPYQSHDPVSTPIMTRASGRMLRHGAILSAER
jgi:hypothetical protein